MYTNAIGELVTKTRSTNASGRVGEPKNNFMDTLSKYAQEDAGMQRTARPQKQQVQENEGKSRQRKLMEMRSRIAELKAQIKEPGSNEALESELSLLQMEMFWLMTEL